MAVYEILLKEVLVESENSVTYGTPISFKIGLAEGSSVEAQSDDNFWYNYENNQIDTECTDLQTIFDFSTDAGKVYQAFDVDDNILGFRLMYCGIYQYQYVRRAYFMIYNLEIGCYAKFISRTSYADDSDTKNNKVVLVINGKYVGNSVSERLKYLESLWFLKGEIYRTGMNRLSFAFIQPFFQLNNGQYTSGIDKGLEGIQRMCRMRYFSSWYKLMTGKFYNQDSLKSMPMSNGKEFYFGRALAWYKNPTGDATSDSEKAVVTEYTFSDPSYAFLDVIYGTDPSQYIPYTYQGKQKSIYFTNGTTIYFSRENFETSSQKIGYTIEKTTEEGKILKFTQIMRGNDYRLDNFSSAMQFMLEKIGNHELYGNYSRDDATFGPALFISPEYNDWPASSFKKKLLAKELPSDTFWRQLLDRVFVFVSERTTTVGENFREKFNRNTYYDSVAFAGILNVNSNKILYNTVYRGSNFGYGGNEPYLTNIENNKDWAEFFDFQSIILPPNTGGGSFGGVGGQGTFDPSSDVISKPTLPRYEKLGGAMLTIWWLNETTDRYNNWTKSISDWLNDSSIFSSFEDRVQGIVSLKCVYAPGQPGNTASDMPFTIRGSKITSGNLPLSYLTHQFEEIDFGDFSVTKFFDSFLDYGKTSIKIYLPFSGTYELNPSLLVGNNCNLSAILDYLTGDIVYNIKVISENLNSVIYTFNGNTAIDLPITSTDYSGKIAGFISTAAGLASTFGLAMSGNMLSAGVSAGNTFIQGAKAIKEPGQIKTTGVIAGQYGMFAVQRPHLIVERPVVQIPENFGRMYGWKTAVSGELSNFSGMTVVKDAHLKGIKGATEAEMNEIEQILKTGVIL